MSGHNMFEIAYYELKKELAALKAEKDEVKMFLVALIKNRPYWSDARFEQTLEEAERLLLKGGWDGKLV